MPKRFSRGWVIACMIACVNAHPSGHEGRRASRGTTAGLGELASTPATDYDFDDLSAEGYVGKMNDPSDDEESEVDGVSSTGPRSKYAALPLVPEPDAEMLPAHYTGVKPPGVDHMEIIFIDSASLGSNRKNSLAEGTGSKGHKSSGGAAVSGTKASRGTRGETGTRRGASSVKSLKGEEGEEGEEEIIFIDSASLGSNLKDSLAEGTELKGHKSSGRAAVSGTKASRGTKGETGTRRGASFVKSLKGEEGKEDRRGEYAESAGTKKARQETDEHFNGHEDETTGEKGATLRLERRREKDRNAAGYRNVYHKNEFKKDADFYDNDHEGGRFHKHGHYDEKHTAAEGDFHKGAGRNAGFAVAEAGKSGKFEDGRNAEEANGRAGKYGRDVRFAKFSEFAKKSDVGAGQSFGNQETAVKVR